MSEISTTNSIDVNSAVSNNTSDGLKPKKKRGRKPNPNKKIYFGEEEEKAFVQYLTTDDKKLKDKIFSEKLFYPFSKMIESIIRRYKLFTPDEDYEDTFFDTMSFLITKINHFNIDKNYKAYSYCGTICKRYLILKRENYMKKIKNEIQYDNIYNINPNNNQNNNEKLIEFNLELIDKTISQLQEMLLSEKSVGFNENEIKIGNALLEMLLNWEEIFRYMGSKKFNKSCVLQFLRDYTNLSTTEIRNAMKKYKDLYFFTKEKMLR